MKVTVRLLGFYQMMLGRMYETVTLSDGANLEDIYTHFKNTYPQFRDENTKKIAGTNVNGEYVARPHWGTRALRDGDRVDLFTQMAGG